MNINDEIYVRLTPSGETAWKEYWSDTSPDVPESVRQGTTDADGRVRFQIWQAMHIFGPDCYMGSSRLPFVNNQIELVAR